MKKLTKSLIVGIFIPTIVWGTGYSPMDLGIMSKTNLDKNLSREETAAIAVKIVGKENQRASGKNKFVDNTSWSKDIVNLVDELGYMKGTSAENFRPKDNIKYIDFLTVVMRTMGYKDGSDLRNYPNGYYQKSLEIGLGNMYIDQNQIVDRKLAYETLEKAINLNIKNTEKPLYSHRESLANIKKPVEKQTPSLEMPKKDRLEIKLATEKINKKIVGLYKGRVDGLDDFTGYKARIISGDEVLKEVNLSRDGKIEILDFEVNTINNILGYRLQILDRLGNTLMEEEI